MTRTPIVQHNGKYVVIDMETGEYEVDKDHLAASLALNWPPRRSAIDHKALLIGSVHAGGEIIVRGTCGVRAERPRGSRLSSGLQRLAHPRYGGGRASIS